MDQKFWSLDLTGNATVAKIDTNLIQKPDFPTSVAAKAWVPWKPNCSMGAFVFLFHSSKSKSFKDESG